MASKPRAPNKPKAPTKPRTSTKSFGSGAREGHDSTPFYSRFEKIPATQISATQNSATQNSATPDKKSATQSKTSQLSEPTPQPKFSDPCILGDSRNMPQLPDNCVALIITSPPYFAGKEYETPQAATNSPSIPTTFDEYLAMLRSVLGECERVLETGGRIAINVANLGRKPYRSLSAEIIKILEEIGFLLRGEIIWQKADGAGNSCAWGSFRSAANPTLRDLTERIIVASKGQFARSLPRRERQKRELPWEDTITSKDFMRDTLDVWRIPPEHATKVGHPAPFPLELPRRLINLYTYKGDLVLDPFMGSGTTLVAARQLKRNSVGYDIDSDYVSLARQRLRLESSIRRPPG